MGSLIKIIAICILPFVTCQYQQFQTQQLQQQQQQAQPEQHDFLDIPPPDFFSFTPSPLQKPDSLRSRPYFDFLSTLYAHDTGKKSLFTQYPKSKREIGADVVLSPVLDALQGEALEPRRISKRAVVFRPLFVYRQQEIKKQKIQEERRRY